jgi:hypothetical protein
VCAVLAAAASASAGTVSGRLDSGLKVTYRGDPGQRDEVRVLAHLSGVRIVDAHGITAGHFCAAVNAYDARCGPPEPRGLTVIARTGDRADVGFTHIGSLILGSDDDVGIAYAASVYGGPGDDDLRGFGDGTLIVGGPGDDREGGTFGAQLL